MEEQMSRKLNVVYNPEEHPCIEISVDRGGDPKIDLLIFCDVIITLIKILDNNSLQADHESMRIVTSRINKGFLGIKNVIAESDTLIEPVFDYDKKNNIFDISPTNVDATNRDCEQGNKPEKSVLPEKSPSGGGFLGRLGKIIKQKKKDHCKELLSDINAAITRQSNKIQFGELLGIVENIKLDIYYQHYKKNGLL